MRCAFLGSLGMVACVAGSGAGLEDLPEAAAFRSGAAAQPLGPGVVEYSARIPVGPGQYDVIGLHRVVGERPEPTGPAVFLVHGSFQDFDQAFADAGDSLAAYLARNGVDVWGIDLRGTSVPASETDFGFMASWAMETHVGDVRLGMAVARQVRAASGADPGPIPVLGFSRGATEVYATVGYEAGLPEPERQASALIAVDMRVRTDDPDDHAQACANYEPLLETWRGGKYHIGPSPLKAVAQVALAAPDAESAQFPGYTNWQIAIGALAAPWLCGGPDCGPTPTWHSHAGASWIPIGPGIWAPLGLAFTEDHRAVERTAEMMPYEDQGTWVDITALQCPEEIDSVWDDNWDQVTVPVLYVGADGAWGTDGYATADEFVSAEVTKVLVHPDNPGCPMANPANPSYNPRQCGFGHTDTLYASNAPEEAWTPILSWLETH